MSVETLKLISLIAYVISGIFLLITIWIYVKFNIAEVIGEITGITRRKAIKDIRSQSSEEKKGFYNPSYARGKSTEKTSKDHSGKLSDKLSGKTGKTKGQPEKLEQLSTSVLENEESGQTRVLDVTDLQESLRLPTRVTVVTEIILCGTEQVIA